MNKNISKNIYPVINYIFGLLGFLGVILAILTVTNVVESIITQLDLKITYTPKDKLILSLSSSILGIFFLFISFSKQIDKFFTFLESHSVRKGKNEEKNGITLESILFFFIAVVLITLAVMLGIGFLTFDWQILGNATKPIFISVLIVLALVALATAFNNIISQSLKEMKKVHWPTGKEMRDYSLKVFSFIIFFSLFFLSLDLLLSYLPKLVEQLFNINL